MRPHFQLSLAPKSRQSDLPAPVIIRADNQHRHSGSRQNHAETITMVDPYPPRCNKTVRHSAQHVLRQSWPMPFQTPLTRFPGVNQSSVKASNGRQGCNATDDWILLLGLQRSHPPPFGLPDPRSPRSSGMGRGWLGDFVGGSPKIAEYAAMGG